MSHALFLSPTGRLHWAADDTSTPPLSPSVAAELGDAFAQDASHGLERLVSQRLHDPLPPTLQFWRQFASRYFTALCHRPEADPTADPVLPPPPDSEWTAFAESAPPMVGLEFLTPGTLSSLWHQFGTYIHTRIARTEGGTTAYLSSCHPAWNAVGRVTFHLAENKRNPAFPFAFLATYTHRLSDQGKVQHLPLGRALEEYAGTKNRAALASLLSPVQKAAERSRLTRELLESRALFHPQVWRPDQAYAFLKDIPCFEECGLVVRIPDWWKAGRPPRPQVTVRVGETGGNHLGAESLLDFEVDTTIDGEPLSPGELEALLKASNGLVLLKGRWVEVNPDQLREVLEHWRKVEREARASGVSMLEGMRLLAGFTGDRAGDATQETTRAAWSSIVAGDRLGQLLRQMQSPEVSGDSDPGDGLHATLRPYQRIGAHWLWFMNQLGLGACLADDMGLGKTIQVLSLLVVLKRTRARAGRRGPSLLVVPASLIANWKAEIARFAPSLAVAFAHPSETDAKTMAATQEDLRSEGSNTDLVITSYSMVTRLEWLKEIPWDTVILDEAQAIKNPGARQTRAVCALQSRHRIALSGTPIENRLTDLWSLFDFLSPGLLGSAKGFATFVKTRGQAGDAPFTPLRRLVRPYILRRLKTDRKIIADLPDKVEMTAFCSLTRKQAALYQQSVEDLEARLESTGNDGIQRRGVILAFLTRFKQICNHPSQWLGDGGYTAADSGKFQRLQSLCEEIASRQERVLLFTQYREITGPLAAFLAGIFGRPGLLLDGSTPVAKRRALVDRFQEPEGPPFFVLSLKAGGTGLNLTAASHVIHFDRWWNPAVENQATDRAFRIGQKRNVVVHKFTCRGTLEERIHEVIAAKQALAEDVLGEGGERLLTEMSNSELLRFVALDITAITDS
jgi:non-specific serine/threonine protein kinase